jgi:23S rRNA (cytidine1920-2'-O)/16S rRNA (cytidine1409-2'-O)-methyltransferase
MEKNRVDLLLVERGLVDTRSLAQRLIMAGQVKVDDQIIFKPSTKVSTDSQLEIIKGPTYVSRGGEKLEEGIKTFDINVSGKICADIGASTGGFSDCLLKYNAKKIYAIDVGKGILHWKLRQDPRIIVMENTNARYLYSLDEEVELISIDVSFISIKYLLPVIQKWFSPDGGQVIALIKPQFEAGKSDVSKGAGVIRDPLIHRSVLIDILRYSQSIGYHVAGLIRSPLRGPKGNIEFLVHLKFPNFSEIDIIEYIDNQIPDLGS